MAGHTKMFFYELLPIETDRPRDDLGLRGNLFSMEPE